MVLLKSGQRGHGNALEHPEKTLTLSITARAVNVILDSQADVTLKTYRIRPVIAAVAVTAYPSALGNAGPNRGQLWSVL